jgi:transposase-like protein
LTVREIQAFLTERSAVAGSPDRISPVPDAVHAEGTAWPQRGREPMYPVVVVDARRVTMRDEGTVRRQAVYLALAIVPDGRRAILGIWIEPTAGAQFWLKVFTDLQTRGCQDLLIAGTDGLQGRSEALAAVFPAPTRPTGLGHRVRHRRDGATWARCARSPRPGARKPPTGGTRAPSSRSCMVHASPRQVRGDPPLHTQNF